MASVFGEQERRVIRERVLSGLQRVRQQGKRGSAGPRRRWRIEGAISSI
jgi:DNA invertase Pin-like site-specific DNA recombinase